MSVSSEITRITGLRNTIRTKLIAIGATLASDGDLEDCADAIDTLDMPTAMTSAQILAAVTTGWNSGGGS